MATPVEDPQIKTKKPSNSAFKQQRLPAWQPILTAGTVLPTFFVIGLAFIPIGIGLLLSSDDVMEKSIDYTSCIAIGNNPKNETCDDRLREAAKEKKPLPTDCQCEMPFHLDKPFKKNVFMYYGLTNYYQNHRRYVKSRSDQQLLGRQGYSTDECKPFAEREIDGAPVVIGPCGAIANSLFNDTLILKFRDSQGEYKPVDLKKDDIVWSTDNVKFKNPDDPNKLKSLAAPFNWHQNISELEGGFQNPDLIVWMRTAALPTFRKLYRRIDHSAPGFAYHLPVGDYKLEIHYNYPVSNFQGTKRVILSNTSWLGGRNPFLGIAYIVVGTICLLLAFVFLVIHNKFGRSTHDIVNISQRTPY